MTENTADAANVFLFHIDPEASVNPAELQRILLAEAAAFSVASRPTIHPALLAHRILRGTDGRLLWEIALTGLESPDDDAPRESLCEALLGEVRERLEGLGRVETFAGYTDLVFPGPGLGFCRAPLEASRSSGFSAGLAQASAPLLGWEDYATDAGTAVAGAELPEDLLAEIEQSRGEAPAEPGLKPVRQGHMYTGASDKAHLAYLHDYLESRAAASSSSDRRKVIAFRAFQAREGSTAAINTYDNQIVTWGTGWGGLGMLGKVMARAAANEALRERLGRAGLRYRDKNVYDVVDLRAKRVITGRKEALETLRSSVPLLRVLIHAARDPRTRDAVTEAQLVTFMETSAHIAGADGIATQALFNWIAHLKHWAPAYVDGCLDWALPQADGGAASVERDQRLAVLVGRYFYGRARKFKWIPDWRQFQLYCEHMKADGLDCTSDPFFRAAASPSSDPFAERPAPRPGRPAKPQILKNAPLAGEPALERVARGEGSLRKRASGPEIKALQEALLAVGIQLRGGVDGVFGDRVEEAVRAFQAERGLLVDGVAGQATLKALDARLGAVRG
ncbi:peptidoglycan-binding domain-containing protein [Sorangium sp. So ce394]|uniref:peptidoglycan-binding domain-containing protein n=1 Tax=Sorangium sp. So ce394 TaxID=3133310 RepID=UPI003F5C3291